MKIQLDLPEYDNPGHREYEVDGFDHRANLCAGCGDELYGLTVRMLPFGWLHAEAIEDNEGKTCQEKAVEKLLADPGIAWISVARHVAKYPTKHSSSTLRAVITQVTNITEASKGRDDWSNAAFGDLTDKLRNLHTDEGGSCGTCADETGQAAAWPCPTIRAVYVTEAAKAGA